jgi:hypothetical protein
MVGVILAFGLTFWLLGGIEVVLTMLFPYQDIFRDGTNDIYLRRFYIYPRNKDFKPNEFKPRIYLHKFYRGDEDPHLHDHPWPYTSLILTEGYFEETPWKPFDESGLSQDDYLRSKLVDSPFKDARSWRRRVFYKPWTILKRPATWKHRVILKDRHDEDGNLVPGGQPAWTLIRTGSKERSWGFWLDDKSELDFCPWRQYDLGVCYCTPEEKK